MIILKNDSVDRNAPSVIQNYCLNTFYIQIQVEKVAFYSAENEISRTSTDREIETNLKYPEC